MRPEPNLRGLPRARIIRAIVLVAAALAGCGQVAMAQQPPGNPSAPYATPPPETVATLAASAHDDQYRIGPGDGLTVQVFNRPQLSREERVDIRGMITMPLIEGEIQAACRTEKELAEEIARLYREHQLLKNPQVYVSVKDYQSQLVAVIGAVNSPGRFQLQRRVRLLELLVFHAGGTTQTAGRSVQVLSTAAAPCEATAGASAGVNEAADSAEGIVSYQLSDLLRGENASNPYVRPGDIISVPVAEQAFILGNVLRPSAIQLTEPITLTRAIAMAGGTLPDTRKDKIRISRQALGSTSKTELFVDLAAIDKHKAEDFMLQGGDIVEVTTKTGLQSVIKGFVKTLLPAASQFPVRVVR